MSDLPVRRAPSSLPAFPTTLPGEVRAKARAGLLRDLDTLQGIIDSDFTKAHVRVQGVKLKAQIGGVLSSASIPRDVVEEKIGQTRDLLVSALGEAVGLVVDHVRSWMAALLR